MPTATPTRTIARLVAPLPEIDVDLLIVPWFEKEAIGSFATLDRAVAGELSRALGSKEFCARPYEFFVTPLVDGSWRARRVAFVGAGVESAYDTSVARRIATSSAYAARQRRIESVAFVMRSGLPSTAGDVDVAGHLQAIAEGLTLAEFDGATYKTSEAALGAPARLHIVVPSLADTSPESVPRLDAAIARGRTLAECSNLARAMANEPGNTLTPSEFAIRAADVAAGGGAAVEVLDERQIAALHMGLLMGVARGSSEPPRLMVFRHTPANVPPGSPVLGLVGKGVTFDSGGFRSSQPKAWTG